MPPFRRHLKGPSNSGQKGPRKRAFKSSRLAGLEDGDVESEPELHEEAHSEELSESSDEDEIPVALINPYNALLQSLNSKSDAHQHLRKRRKLGQDRDSVVPANGHTRTLDQDENLVDEAEAGAEEAEPEDEEEISSDDEDSPEDPFQKHVEINEKTLSSSINGGSIKSAPAQRIQLGNSWKAIVAGPVDCPARITTPQSSNKISLESYKIKARLTKRFKELSLSGTTGINGPLADRIFNLQDILFCGRSHTNARSLQELICLHTLNYVLKTRDRILRNSAKLSRAEGEDLPDCRDQGFTRPKVLILLPTRQACHRMVDLIVSLYEPEQQENRKRFNESFSRKADDISNDKPEDFRELFAGNDDDLFRLGMKFTRKTVKFFSQFYNSDIIFASPLGLRMAMITKDSKKEDYDFLSSIELVIMDQADALLQQNWEHVEHVFKHLNMLPKEHHGCDFSRVRNWYLDGKARYLRQTIILTSFLTPEINQIASQHMLNVEGNSKITPETFDGAIVKFSISIKQTFIRFDALSPQKEPDARFKAFTTMILPSIVKATSSRISSPHGILIFVPSYMDFVRIRNFMASSTNAQDISFGTISEYTSSSDVARARSHFVSGRHSVLLYSGRAHHFRRYKLKGVKKVFIYSLPDNPVFYSEVSGDYLARSVSEGLVAPEDACVRSLFCKWDVLKLERVAGSKRIGPMLKDQAGEVFDFS